MSPMEDKTHGLQYFCRLVPTHPREVVDLRPAESRFHWPSCGLLPEWFPKGLGYIVKPVAGDWDLHWDHRF